MFSLSMGKVVYDMHAKQTKELSCLILVDMHIST